LRIGVVTVGPIGAVADGQPVRVAAVMSQGASDATYAWSGPAGTTAPLQTTGPELAWTFAAATDAGVYQCIVSSLASTDSPQVGAWDLQLLRTINRFGRIYTAFDPDGAGAGPSTWILAGPGAAVNQDSFASAQRGVLSAASASVALGSPIALLPDGTLTAAAVGDYEHANVVGLALISANPGKMVIYTADGAITQPDWASVSGASALTPGARYFVDGLQPGRISSSPPAGTGVFASIVGRATSSRSLEIEIATPIRL
jgi:hypothetical protein